MTGSRTLGYIWVYDGLIGLLDTWDAARVISTMPDAGIGGETGLIPIIMQGTEFGSCRFI
jgi:hypothetical protein